jgi:hypothetical protein
MNLKTIAIIALSAFVLLLVFIGAVSIFLKWRKVGRPSSAVGPALTSPTNKRSGKFVNLFVRSKYHAVFLNSQWKMMLYHSAYVLVFLSLRMAPFQLLHLFNMHS